MPDSVHNGVLATELSSDGFVGLEVLPSDMKQSSVTTHLECCQSLHGRNQCGIGLSGRKAALERKHVLAPLGGTHGKISSNFCVSAHRGPSLTVYSRFYPDPFRFGGVITELPPRLPK